MKSVTKTQTKINYNNIKILFYIPCHGLETSNILDILHASNRLDLLLLVVMAINGKSRQE